jgi:integrase/recombinase XerD
VAETVEAKQTANRRPRYVRGLQSYLRLFARGREEMNIAEVTPALIEDWFAARKEKPETRAASLGRLGALFDLAWRRGWIPENPCKRVERPSTERKPAAVLTSRQCEQLLSAAREFCPRFLPALILMMFAGVRPEETRRLCWDDVSLDAGLLNVGAAASKLRQRRVVHLSPNCVAWLRTVHGQEGLPAAKGQKRLRLVRRKAGIEQWPQDVLRHTACSMWLHRDSDAAKVAMEMGHSVQTMFRHYRNIVSDEECRLFWSLLPSSDVSAAGSDAPNS